MFHSVGLESHSWIWNMLSESVGSFEAEAHRPEGTGIHYDILG